MNISSQKEISNDKFAALYTRMAPVRTKPENWYSFQYSQVCCQSSYCSSHHCGSTLFIRPKHVNKYPNTPLKMKEETYKNHNPVSWHMSGDKFPSKLFPRKPLITKVNEDL